MNDAREFFRRLPNQLEEYLDADYQSAFNHLMGAVEEFFDVALTIDHQAEEDHLISSNEATDIGEHAFILLLKLINLMEKLDLPHKRRELEQVSLIFARWVIQYNGQLNHIEPITNAFAHTANNMTDKRSLRALVELMTMVVTACADPIKHDLDSSSLYRPWRLLLINRSIVATRTHDLELIRQVFDDMVFYLPQDAASFFSEGMDEIDSLDYPPEVQELIEQYFYNQPRLRIH
jgi:hypothetical protein